MASLTTDLESLARIGADDSGVTRFPWSPELAAANEWLVARLEALGLEAAVDPAGNVVGKWHAGDGKAVVVGSHLDTVPRGGRFDGALGVLAGLAALETLREDGFEPRQPLWLVSFNDEEGVRFGTSFLGSRSFVGEPRPDEWRGRGVDAAMAAAGFDFERLGEARAIDAVGAYLEVHIEQGPVLEQAGVDVGVVTAIAGLLALRVRLRGEANHAGTTPMPLRRDALAGAARVVLALRDEARRRDDMTANVGRIAVEPGGTNVVPGVADFTVDVRSPSAEGFERTVAFARETIERVAEEEWLGVEIEELHRIEPVSLDSELRDVLARAAAAEGASHVPIASGAGHDAMILARHVPAAMLFVPSRGGLSHSPEEYTPPEQCELGARILARALASLAGGRLSSPRMRAATTTPGLAESLERLGTETAFDVLVRAKELEREGRDVIHLEVGEPDFATPEHICEAAAEAIRAGETKYCPANGIPEFREAVAAYFTASRGIDIPADRCLVANGGKPFLFFTILATCNPGDEVIYPDPGFPIYESAITWSGATPVPLPLLEERDFVFAVSDLADRLSERTKMVILNSPENPTGGVIGAEELAHAAQLIADTNAWVLSDEIYSQILYDGEFTSIATLPGMLERTVILDGLSKTYAMTGWRCGFAAVPEPLVDPIVRFFINSTSCVPPFVQHAGIAALTGPQEPVRAMVDEFRRRRDLVVEGLNALPGISCRTPQGAFYVFPNVGGAPLPARELADRLLEEAGVAVVAGTAFGEVGRDNLRLSYANSRENIERALARMGELLEAL